MNRKLLNRNNLYRLEVVLKYIIPIAVPFLVAVNFGDWFFENVQHKVIEIVAVNIAGENSSSDVLVTVSSILIGFIITVVSIFGSSNSSAIILLLKGNKSKVFLLTAMLAVLLNLLNILVLSTASEEIVQSRIKLFLFLLIFVSTYSYTLTYSLVVIFMFKTNIDASSREYDQELKFREEVMKYLSSHVKRKEEPNIYEATMRIEEEND
jgi:hypothetical protein